MDKLVTLAMFKGEYLKNIPAGYQWQKTPMQVYPLSFLSNHFKLPLPIIQTDYNFLFYIKEGNFVNRINNELYQCEAGSLVFVSVSSVSALQKISKDLKGYFILIEDKAMSVLFNQQELLNVFLIDPVLKLKSAESDWIHMICRLLFTELSTKSPNLQIGSNLIQALLNKILHLSEKSRTISRTQQIAIQFKQLVHQHFIDEKKISFYADRLAVSANYLNRCVKAVFDKSCKEIIMEVAILNSQILLVDNTKSISEISFEMNFEDPSYFTRIFKSFTGLTPSEYRTRIMQDLS
ncbi:helix-turn-helix domain-containing protein [Sphingobacterium faecium]|uniref:helix-turn-helix domain-containing protein n=1 Tax=Sphingobacterium faecium TaxID=34087 RepID=UPI003207965B